MPTITDPETVASIGTAHHFTVRRIGGTPVEVIPRSGPASDYLAALFGRIDQRWTTTRHSYGAAHFPADSGDAHALRILDAAAVVTSGVRMTATRPGRWVTFTDNGTTARRYVLTVCPDGSVILAG